jgi:hypothetical protein
MTQAVNLANFANNLDSSGGLNPSALNAATPISKGGTASTTASAARAALGVDYVTIGQLIYPVGSIYINAGVITNPSTLLGFGTWVAFGAGRVMVSLNSSDPAFDALGDEGGSKDAILVSHTHTASSTSTSSFTGNPLPPHSHTYPIASEFGSPRISLANFNSENVLNASSSVSGGTPSGSVSTSTSTTLSNEGSSGVNANLQPYITVAMWKRTA